MKQKQIFRRAISLLLMAAMLAGFAVPIQATGTSSQLALEIEQIGKESVTAESPIAPMGKVETPETPSSNEMVRVSIQLEQAPTIDAGFEIQNIAQNASAMRYRDDLKSAQDQMQTAIERHALDGQKLDVVWNLTLAANMISANVPRSAIARIAAMDGVKAVVEETRYQPDVVSVGGEYRPDMAVSSQMTGANQAWLEGYTGAGRRIAIIDTGLDIDHQSFDPEAFAYGLEQASKASGMTYELLDTEEIGGVLKQLNAYRRAMENGQSLSAQDLYINAKAAFGYNYIDGDLDVTHDHDTQGEHGSHVAGIAAANRYLKRDGAYVDAMEAVQVTGNAPDAQLLVMKVFGKNGGAFDSDIMIAIEDAMILGADAVNLSLGSTSAGMAEITDETYRALMERVVDSGMVVVTSAGNDGYWAMYSSNGYLYSDGVNYDTVGAPGSYASSLAIASVDNDGVIGPSLLVGETSMGYMESLADNYGFAFGNGPIAALDTSADGSGTAYDFLYIDGYGTAEDYAGMDLTGKIVLCSRGGDYYYYDKANTAAELGAAALIVYNNEAGVLYMDLSGYRYAMPAVLISRANGEAIKAAATEQKTEAGTSYFTGKITIRSKLSGNYENSQYPTVSSFSSWGVPGDLSIKPEITAPGGNIYSVNGAAPETDQYELMSGTSMACPQVAGLAALVKQYLEENSLHSSTLNDRALTQALLMSTAKLMRNGSNGNYYPVFQQGAGLADVSAALRSPAYFTVDGTGDGMAKAELGDDPARTRRLHLPLPAAQHEPGSPVLSAVRRRLHPGYPGRRGGHCLPGHPDPRPGCQCRLHGKRRFPGAAQRPQCAVRFQRRWLRHPCGRPAAAGSRDPGHGAEGKRGICRPERRRQGQYLRRASVPAPVSKRGGDSRRRVRHRPGDHHPERCGKGNAGRGKSLRRLCAGLCAGGSASNRRWGAAPGAELPCPGLLRQLER